MFSLHGRESGLPHVQLDPASHSSPGGSRKKETPSVKRDSEHIWALTVRVCVRVCVLFKSAIISGIFATQASTDFSAFFFYEINSGDLHKSTQPRPTHIGLRTLDLIMTNDACFESCTFLF